MKKRKKIGRKLLSFVLALAMIISNFTGLVPGMGLTAYADNTEELLTTLTFGGSSTYSETTSGVVSVTATNVTYYDSQYGWLWFDEGSLSVTAEEGYTINKCVFRQNNKQPITDTEAPFEIHFSDGGCTVDGHGIMDGVTSIEVYRYATPTTVDVTDVSLNKTTTTLTVGDTETLTATVSPDDATDKTVTWSVGGTDPAAVKLYSDANCTAGNEIGTDATSTRTVYAKGISAGSATVTVTSNADSEKKASCDVTVNAAQTQTETLLTTITATGIDSYSQSKDGVVTVTLANIASYNEYGWSAYNGTITVEPVDGYTITKCRFIQNNKTPLEDDLGPFSIVMKIPDTPDVARCSVITSNGQKGGGTGGGAMDGVTSIEVYGYSSKAAQTITASDVTATYGDTDKSVSASVTTPATGGGAISYTVKDGSVDYIDVSSDGKLTIKKVPASGKAYVIVKAAATDDYAETTKEVTVTIAKADPETPMGITGKYGQRLSTVSLPVGWSWADNDTIMSAGVGDYTYQANYNPTDATNYNSLSNVDLTVNVGKGDGTISFGETVVESTIGAEPPSVYFESTGDGLVTFTSDNENVATVNDNGYLTIKGVGETTITASVVDSATYQYATKSVSYKLTVKKRSASIKTVPTASEITYGQTLADSTLSGGEVYGSIEGTFSWADSGIAPAVSDSETTEYAVKFTPKNSDNYAESTCKVKIKVNKKKVSATELNDTQKPVAKTGDDVVYTGEPIELVKAPTTNLPMDYEAFYSTDGENWSKDIPKKTDPGTYIIKVKYVSKGNNCNDITLDDITATITPADKKALTDAITAAKEYYDAIKGNTDYSEAADKLDKAIKAAEAVAAKNKLTKSEVSTAAEALNTAKTTAEAEVKDIDDPKAAQAVSDKIAALPAKDEVTKEDKTAIDEARAAYNALTEDQKAKVTPETLKKLTDAEDKLAVLLAMSEVSAKTGSNMTYTGNPIQLINTPTTALPEGYKMVYAVTTENKAPTDENLYTTSIPTGTNAGTYYVWYRVVGDGFESSAGCVTVVINEEEKLKPGDIVVSEGDLVSEPVAETKYVTAEATVNGEKLSVTISENFVNAIAYTGKRIDAVAHLNMSFDKTPIVSRFKIVDGSSVKPEDLIKVSYVQKYNKRANAAKKSKPTVYARIKVSKDAKKALSREDYKSLKKLVKKLNRELKKNQCNYRINQRSVTACEVKVVAKHGADGKIIVKNGKISGVKKVIVSIDVKDPKTGEITKNTFKLSKKDYSISDPNPENGTVRLTGKRNFTGTVTVKVE